MRRSLSSLSSAAQPARASLQELPHAQLNAAPLLVTKVFLSNGHPPLVYAQIRYYSKTVHSWRRLTATRPVITNFTNLTPALHKMKGQKLRFANSLSALLDAIPLNFEGHECFQKDTRRLTKR